MKLLLAKLEALKPESAPRPQKDVTPGHQLVCGLHRQVKTSFSASGLVTQLIGFPIRTFQLEPLQKFDEARKFLKEFPIVRSKKA